MPEIFPLKMLQKTLKTWITSFYKPKSPFSSNTFEKLNISPKISVKNTPLKKTLKNPLAEAVKMTPQKKTPRTEFSQINLHVYCVRLESLCVFASTFFQSHMCLLGTKFEKHWKVLSVPQTDLTSTTQAMKKKIKKNFYGIEIIKEVFDRHVCVMMKEWRKGNIAANIYISMFIQMCVC